MKQLRWMLVVAFAFAGTAVCSSQEAAGLTPLTGEILFDSSREGHQEIYVMKADGSEQRRLTFSPKFIAHPDFR